MKTALQLLITLMSLSATVWGEAPERFKHDLEARKWVAYSPSTGDPITGRPPFENEIKEDLARLKKSGFDGIVTYGCLGTLGSVPSLAAEVGIEHVILGVSNPTNTAEITTAKSVASQVDGYCVGNERILAGSQRYSLAELKVAIDDLRESTKKPVTTSEEVDDYLKEPALIEIGDWIFPNAHRYWANLLTESSAVEWTKSKFAEVRRLAGGKLVILKEVGFPTAGAPNVTEQAQANYYKSLSKSEVRFIYFEAFDQSWKKHKDVEPHWGLFRADRSPKLVVQMLFETTPPSTTPSGVRDERVVSLEITMPKSKGKVLCVLTGEGGQIPVSGTSKGIFGTQKQLLLFVNPRNPAARGWYLQFKGNGIDDFKPDGSWSGIAQLGNRSYPPSGGEQISIAIVALPEEEASRLITEADRAQGETPLRVLPQVPAESRAEADNVIVEIKKR